MPTTDRSSRSTLTEAPRRRRAILVAATLALCPAGCSSADAPSAQLRAPSGPPAQRWSETGAGPGFRLSGRIVFRGACDASGAAGVATGLIAVADDEDNRLRVYHTGRGGQPVALVDAVRDPSGHPVNLDEMDLEGSATVGSRVYWVASHGRKKSGKRAPSRLMLFATDIGPDGQLAPVGRPYNSLLHQMVEEPSLARYRLRDAADRSPISPGGLNIEGLTDTPEGHLLLGFRNPVPGGRALLVRITNPADMVERGARPRFGPSVELDLEGRGIRTIASWDNAYWIVGGDIADPILPSRLYRWDGSTARPVWIDSADLGDLNIEAIATVPTESGARLLLISDDGSRSVGGKKCKKLRDPAAKYFRASWLEAVPALSGRGGSRSRAEPAAAPAPPAAP
jgi:hypothetical protein